MLDSVHARMGTNRWSVYGNYGVLYKRVSLRTQIRVLNGSKKEGDKVLSSPFKSPVYGMY